MLFQPVVRLAHRRGREGVGGDPIGAGVQVAAVHGEHGVRAGQVEEVDVPLQRPRMVPEALAPEVLLGELESLDEGAGRTVQDHDPLVQQGAQAPLDAAVAYSDRVAF